MGKRFSLAIFLEVQVMMMEFLTSSVKLDGFSMDYIRFGHGEKTFVILPGLSVQSVIPSAGAIVQAYRVLTDDFTVYLFDRRKELPVEYTMQQMADDTYAAMQTLGLQQVHLFGASQGGMIAMLIAADHPSFVEKLVLGSTTCRITDKQYQRIDQWIAAAANGKLESLYLSFGEAIYPPKVFAQYRNALVLLSKNATDEDCRRFGILAGSLKGFDCADRLQQIHCPVLLLGCKDDGVVGAAATEMLADKLQHLPFLELHLYDGYGHAAYDTAPDYKERILRFLCK